MVSICGNVSIPESGAHFFPVCILFLYSRGYVRLSLEDVTVISAMVLTGPSYYTNLGPCLQIILLIK